jgi:hypothetical protein
LPISLKLLPPELRPCLGQPEELAGVSVPEAPVHKDNRVEPRKHQIRLARQTGNVETVPEAEAVKTVTELNLDPGIRTSNSGHHFASFLLRDYVHHGNAS